MKSSTEKLKLLLKETFAIVPPKRKCNCGEALRDAKI
jgi:hypothetical protein